MGAGPACCVRARSGGAAAAAPEAAAAAAAAAQSPSPSRGREEGGGGGGGAGPRGECGARMGGRGLAAPRWPLHNRLRVRGGGRGAWRAGGAAAGGRSQPRPRTEAARLGLPDRAQGAGRGRGRVSAPAPRCCPRDQGSAVPSVRPLPRPPSADTSASQSAASRVPALPALCLLRLAMCSPLQRCSPLWFLLPLLNFVIVEATV